MNGLANHPMHLYDRPLIEGIVSKKLKELSKENIVDLARLLNRYNPTNDNLKDIIIAYLHENNKTPEQLHIKSREIWQSGWRPGSLDNDEIGSGADVDAGS
jgi:hypothetical protein